MNKKKLITKAGAFLLIVFITSFNYAVARLLSRSSGTVRKFSNGVKGICLFLFLFVFFLTGQVGCGAGSSSSGSSGTYTPTTQMIWKNGSLGAWNGNALTAAIAIYTVDQATTSSVAVTDTVSGGTPSLQLISASSYTESFEFRLNNLQDCSEFNYGHLQFNMRLETTNIIGITVNASNGTFTDGQNVNLSVGAFNTSQFTHASIPLSSIFSNRFSTIRYVMILKITRNPRINDEPLVTINDVKWTTD